MNGLLPKIVVFQEVVFPERTRIVVLRRGAAVGEIRCELALAGIAGGTVASLAEKRGWIL